ncbi:MAG: type I-B CRISPR-associated protein Cas7/Cst2/DevR [candidate division WOR-3 bacterium]|nr:type I-B CRISPR-associated protein Cas7/Cst2/DevR [candidate division WOR-3 bacterium]
MNLFGTILTYTAPSANYRGEGAENRAVIQKITTGRHEYAIISPEAIRNAVRETLATLDLPCNRKRLDDEVQLAVEFAEYPDADEYADDFFMGWLVAAKEKEREPILKELKAKKRDPAKFTFKRDSILRMNMAVALEPYRHDSVFTQSPQDKTPKERKAHVNVENSQLLHRETALTAYQYPFALNIEDCGRTVPKDEDATAKALREKKVAWTRALLKAIGELNDVAGNHARSYFEFAPASVALRLTKQLVAGYSTYGFHIEEDGRHTLPEVVDGIRKCDYEGTEFYLGGKLVKDMDETTYDALKAANVHLIRSPQALLKQVADDAFAG